MRKHILTERPFEYLKDSKGVKFPETTVNNWYIARAFVLDKLNDVAFAPGEDGHLHVIVESDSPLMLSVIRSVALYAHYLNFEEEDLYGNVVAKNRTVITVVSDNKDIEKELRKEEYLCNLLDCCRWSMYGGEMHNADSYIDIEIQVVKEIPDDKSAKVVRICESEIAGFVSKKVENDIYTIDTRKAILLNRTYELGSFISNLPAEDIHSAKRYAMALDVFQYGLLQEEILPMIKKDEWEKNQRKVKNGLSSIFSSDCFESRALAMEKCGKRQIRNWGDYNKELSVSEHARWVVERLIMGYRPFSDDEYYQYEKLFGNNRAKYCRMLKNDTRDWVHLDICSFRDLRRINPEDMKYDSFLLLAIPKILERVK